MPWQMLHWQLQREWLDRLAAQLAFEDLQKFGQRERSR